ncbi:DNA-binding protein [Wenjunlia vitaminophila]|uniref:DNA-binding protein n=1 Tax=Wenjunlia vitaminophila TaxID=76728 RepID=A0A0T6LQS2_WENVI|nr:helix-turn-helix transcriptional regulator [Wenjunlia vitaminophila]KRV48471.1 DNA-binding protein [Wenjunlia vitaminophila]
MDISAPERSTPLDGAAFLGQEVRYARERAGLTQQELADETCYDRTYVSRVEGGSRLASERFAAACDRAFQTSGYFARLRGRVSEQGHPEWFVPYLRLEQEAAAICDYSNAFVMGIVQTPAYAEAVFRATHPREDAEQIRARVDARMHRHDILDRPTPPLLWVVLHEATLRTVVGGPEVMRDQLRRLVAETESPHVTIQVFPFRAGAPASHVPFTLLRQDDGATVAYSETLVTGHVTDSATSVVDAQAAYDRLRATALSPEDSLAFIREALEAYTP